MSVSLFGVWSIMESKSNEIADIKQQMRQVRMSMRVDVHELVKNARSLTDWRHHWRLHPWASCGAAAVLGFLVVPRRRFGNADAQRLTALSEPSLALSSRSNPIISELAAIALGILIQQGKHLVAHRMAREI
ncbi:MAG TPA: hypothetical protein VL475_13830 [Planctomycetaceae bacterium]|nr:hypothetical protein [Planctomycetaceae bacterium]